MTYFQNIRSLADLKKEYRRLALEHHPDKGGDTAIMQQVNTEFEKLYDVWKDRQDVSVSTDRKSTRLNSSHRCTSRMPSSA